MLLGYLFKKFEIFPKETPTVLNLFIIYVSLPAIVLLEVPKIVFSSAILIPVFIAWMVTLLGALTIIVFSKIFKWDRNITGALLLVGVLGNTSFIGIPIVSYYYGSEALPYVMIYDQLGTFLSLSTYGAVVVAIYSGDGSVKTKDIVKKIFTFPPFLSLLVAFGLHGMVFHEEILNILSTLGNTLIPVALISVGYSLQLKIDKKDMIPFMFGLSTKLVFIPLFALILVYIFGFKGLVSDISIMESAMGPMITAGVVASMAGLSPKLSSSIVGYGVILSIFTTAIVFELIQLL